jgi:16S rRNA (cytosine967-C5)-methyltransferase
MARLQKRILVNVANLLKPGGTLVYSTCSITVEENEEVVQSLIDVYPEYRLVESSPRLGDHGLRGMDEAQRLYPYKHGSNGFFIAKLVKDI